MPAPYADPTSYVPYTGLIERHRGQGIDIMYAAAVGGGSVPYHGMAVQPQRESLGTWPSSSACRRATPPSRPARGGTAS